MRLEEMPAVLFLNGHVELANTSLNHQTNRRTHGHGSKATWCTYPKMVPLVLTHSHMMYDAKRFLSVTALLSLEYPKPMPVRGKAPLSTPLLSTPHVAGIRSLRLKPSRVNSSFFTRMRTSLVGGKIRLGGSYFRPRKNWCDVGFP